MDFCSAESSVWQPSAFQKPCELTFGPPKPGNPTPAPLFDANCFSVTCPLRDSLDEAQRAPVLGIFINGLPLIASELQNNVTKPHVPDVIAQSRRATKHD